MSYDFFVAKLRCAFCGKSSALDTSTNMQTYLRDDADMSALKVGDPLPLDLERIRRQDYDGYLTVTAPDVNEPIRILQTWGCPSCGAQANWAEIVVRGGLIESIRPTVFDRFQFENAALVSNDAISVAASLTGKPFSELVKLDVVQLLRATL